MRRWNVAHSHCSLSDVYMYIRKLHMLMSHLVALVICGISTA